MIRTALASASTTPREGTGAELVVLCALTVGTALRARRSAHSVKMASNVGAMGHATPRPLLAIVTAIKSMVTGLERFAIGAGLDISGLPVMVFVQVEPAFRVFCMGTAAKVSLVAGCALALKIELMAFGRPHRVLIVCTATGALVACNCAL